MKCKIVHSQQQHSKQKYSRDFLLLFWLFVSHSHLHYIEWHTRTHTYNAEPAACLSHHHHQTDRFTDAQTGGETVSQWLTCDEAQICQAVCVFIGGLNPRRVSLCLSGQFELSFSLFLISSFSHIYQLFHFAYVFTFLHRIILICIIFHAFDIFLCCFFL